MTLFGAALLVLAGAALVDAAWCAAQAAGLHGLPAVLAAVAVAAGLAAAQTLALGLVGLADERWVLVGLALASAAVARAAWSGARPLPQPSRSALTGALVGGAAALAAWQLRSPFISPDGWLYHLPIAASWATEGNAGSVVEAVAGLPVGNYPVTNELLLSWTLVLADSWAPVSLWSLALASAGAAGLWLAGHGLGAPARWAAVAAGAVIVLPPVVTQVGSANTDVPALSWGAVAAGLAVTATRGTPGALGPAFVAAGLAIGTKTTVAIPLAIVLGWALLRTRPLPARPLGAGATLGAVVGLPWMVRNMVEHGSPLWPLVAFPGGDPLPEVLRPFNTRFASDAFGLLGRYGSGYAEFLAGGVALLAGALIIAGAAGARRARAVGAIALFAVAAWSLAPYTGIDEVGLAPGAMRYLLPALAVGAVACALAAGDPRGPIRAAARALLIIAVAVSLVRDLAYGFPFLPKPLTLVAGAVGGAALLALAPRRAVRAALPTGLAALVVVLALGGPGYVARHARVGLADAELLRAALAHPAFGDDGLRIAMGPATVGLLRGDRLQHEVVFVETCREARDADWLVLQAKPPSAAYDHLRRCVRGHLPAWTDGTFYLFTTWDRDAP